MASLEELEKAIEKGIGIYAKNTGVRFSQTDLMTDVMFEVRKLFPKPVDPERLARALITQNYGVPFETPLCQAEVDYGGGIGIDLCQHPLPCPEHPSGK